METRLLLVEDEEGLADSLSTEFQLEGIQVTQAHDGLEALEIFNDQPDQFDVIILDWMLPRLDGFSVLRKIRKESDVQIIMLTARDYIGDKLAGLTNGADDYITKPFETEELLARIEIAKRHGQRPLEENQELRVADLIVDIKKKRVSENGIIIPLTQREFDLLVVLITHENEPCTRDYLLDTVWGVDFEGQPNILDVYIKNLRNKLDQNEDQPKLIHTIRGTGYMLSANVSNNWFIGTIIAGDAGNWFVSTAIAGGADSCFVSTAIASGADSWFVSTASRRCRKLICPYS